MRSRTLRIAGLDPMSATERPATVRPLDFKRKPSIVSAGGQDLLRLIVGRMRGIEHRFEPGAALYRRAPTLRWN